MGLTELREDDDFWSKHILKNEVKNTYVDIRQFLEQLDVKITGNLYCNGLRRSWIIFDFTNEVSKEFDLECREFEDIVSGEFVHGAQLNLINEPMLDALKHVDQFLLKVTILMKVKLDGDSPASD